MREIILFIMDWIREKLDPEYAADLAAYHEKQKAQQRLIEAESRALQADIARLVNLQAQRVEIEGQIDDAKVAIRDLERRREEIRNEVRTKVDAVRRGDVDDLRRAPL